MELKIKKIICFLCEEIKLKDNTNWQSCMDHAQKFHGIDVKVFRNMEFNDKSEGWLLKLPDGNPWAFVSN